MTRFLCFPVFFLLVSSVSSGLSRASESTDPNDLQPALSQVSVAMHVLFERTKSYPGLSAHDFQQRRDFLNLNFDEDEAVRKLGAPFKMWDSAHLVEAYETLIGYAESMGDREAGFAFGKQVLDIFRKFVRSQGAGPNFYIEPALAIEIAKKFVRKGFLPFSLRVPLEKLSKRLADSKKEFLSHLEKKIAEKKPEDFTPEEYRRFLKHGQEELEKPNAYMLELAKLLEGS